MIDGKLKNQGWGSFLACNYSGDLNRMQMQILRMHSQTVGYLDSYEPTANEVEVFVISKLQKKTHHLQMSLNVLFNVSHYNIFVISCVTKSSALSLSTQQVFPSVALKSRILRRAHEGNINPNWLLSNPTQISRSPGLGFVSPPSCDLPIVHDYVISCCTSISK